MPICSKNRLLKTLKLLIEEESLFFKTERFLNFFVRENSLKSWYPLIVDKQKGNTGSPKGVNYERDFRYKTII